MGSSVVSLPCSKYTVAQGVSLILGDTIHDTVMLLRNCFYHGLFPKISMCTTQYLNKTGSKFEICIPSERAPYKLSKNHKIVEI